MPHHTTTRADTLKKDRERKKEDREEMKEAGIPTTHVLNRAIAEGFFYCLDAGRAQGIPVNEIRVSVQDVTSYATNVLTRHTNGTDRYDEDAVVTTIKKRITNKSDSKFRIKPTWVLQDDDD